MVKVIIAIVALIALPIIAAIVYFAATLSVTDKDASQFADVALGQIAQTFDANVFLGLAAPNYDVSLLRRVSARAGQDAAPSMGVVGGGTPDSVKRTFAAAKAQLGPFTAAATVKCKDTAGVILCLGVYSYERGNAALLATLLKSDADYEIRDLRIVPADRSGAGGSSG